MSDVEHRRIVIAAPRRRIPRILRRVARALLVIFLLATALSFAGSQHWFADLFSHFRAQYILGLGIGGVLLFWHRMWTSGAFAVLGLGGIGKSLLATRLAAVGSAGA